MIIIPLFALLLIGLMICDADTSLLQPTPRRSNGWLNCDTERWDRGGMMPPVVPYHNREKE